jgi:probable phosphoglycerate mutase
VKSLLLIRHGQAAHQVEKLTGGWTDTDLTELGRQQARLLAGRLRQELDEVKTRIICSDLQRTRQTAEILSWELGLRVEFTSALREFNNGLATGKTMEEARQMMLEPTEPILEWRPFPEAENWREFYLRVANFMDEVTKVQETPLILITHGGTINNIVLWWLQLELDWLYQVKIQFPVSPASLTVLRYNEWDEHTVERLNDIAHLYVEGMADPIEL